MTTSLHTTNLFSHLEGADRDMVDSALIETRTVFPGEVICREFRTPDEVFVIVEGIAALTRHGLGMGTIHSGDAIGELSLIDDMVPTETVTARTIMTLQVFSRDHLAELIEKSPAIAIAIARTLARQLRQTRAVYNPAGEIW